MAGAGEANGDGHADLILGERRADSNERSCSGSAHVILGLASPR